METAIMKISEINPAAYNPRVKLKPGDEQYEALKNSLERFGVATPLIVNKATGTLISGHQRLNVLKANGAEEVEVVLVELDEEKERLLNIALNKIEGDWDYGKLEALFNEISPDDIKFTGFSENEIEALFGNSENIEATESGGTDKEVSEDKSNDEKEKADKPESEFNVFLSFPSKELANKWLSDRGIELEFTGTNRNITIRMEGAEYGTGN